MNEIAAVLSAVVDIIVFFVFIGIAQTLKKILAELREMNGKKDGVQRVYGKR